MTGLKNLIELSNILCITFYATAGGLGFTSDQIGTTLLIAGVLMMAPQIYFFHKVRIFVVFRIPHTWF